MKHPIWLLALVVSMGLACKKDGTAEKLKLAAAPSATPYTLEMNFEGLVGYVNVADGVWALLPKADPSVALPVGGREDLDNYPPHYAVLKVSGKNVRGIDFPIDLQIPIDGFDLELPQNVFGGAGTGLDPSGFRQDSGDAAAEKLATGVLDSTPSVLLAARIKLPRTDLKTYQGSILFKKVYPLPPDKDGICDEPSNVTGDATRVESVSWSPQLSEDLKLTIHRFGQAGFTLVLGPAASETTFKVQIVNQMADSLYDDQYEAAHWPAYRWYYNISSVKTCKDHYYPQGPAGGNRCPQKLYSE